MQGHEPGVDPTTIASGSGYDKAGTALGQAIEQLFAEELKSLRAGAVVRGPAPNDRTTDAQGVHGLTLHECGGIPMRALLDGACGIKCMYKVLRALGFADVASYSTGKLSDMVLASGRKS